MANSEDPDQTPHSAASDLGLHCLPMSPKWAARLIWVNIVCRKKNEPFIYIWLGHLKKGLVKWSSAYCP